MRRGAGSGVSRRDCYGVGSCTASLNNPPTHCLLVVAHCATLVVVMIVVKRLVWDGWNSAHVGRHNVTPSEVEEVCHNDPLVREGYKNRLVVLGNF